jgi:hypothetical protein
LWKDKTAIKSIPTDEMASSISSQSRGDHRLFIRAADRRGQVRQVDPCDCVEAEKVL